ncbi:site-specific integrase [Aminobacter sp. SR38]|uniref:tyrosine-type recombinase/integrase n=1 Tax=Aminobacter sp. SR38 TaxID=2774562 RepID=UPI001780AC15|nr:tyrosine-type recombinase/integrase [Aminobacter sp. SR38]QOF71433.1 site-specific integrase [Aminobacter sp. SR38]
MSDEVSNIDLPFIEKNKSRHGTMRFYFRVDGKRLARLPDDPNSEKFSQDYWKARNAHESGQSRPPEPVENLLGKPIPGTFRALCVAYQRSDAFLRLDDTTRAKRKAIIDSMLLEPIKRGGSKIFASMPIAALDVANMEILRNRKSDTPFAADERLKILRQVFETTRPGKDGKPERIVRQNLARLVEPYRKKTDGHHTIRDNEIEQYIRHHGPESKAVLAIVIMMYTGLRVSDLAAIGPQHRRGDRFMLKLFKNRNRTPVTLEIPIHPTLEAVLALHPVKGMNYLMTEYGKPFTIKGLGNRVSDWFSQAHLPHCTAHTVRKGLATSLAESEATDSMLDGLFGWKDGKTSKIYTARKQQAKLARQAISRIDWGEIGNMLPHPDQGVAIPDASAKKSAK